MMWESTPEEIQAREARIQHLANSDDLRDRITCILIDTRIGQLGLYEEDARIKAEAIAHLVEVWMETDGKTES